MADREKVINELRRTYDITAIPESMVITYNWVIHDALAILKEQDEQLRKLKNRIELCAGTLIERYVADDLLKIIS